MVKKLELSHVITSEIKDCVKTNSTVKRSLITKVLAGRLVKKYRCKTALKKSTGLSLNSISEDKTIKLVKVRRNHAGVEDMKKKVAAFYERDDVSRMMPGKQDATKSGGELKQTRILNDYLSSLHEKFKSENIDMKCSFAQFCKLRPRHVRLTSLISRNTCLCRIHQNMALKLKCF